MVHGGEAGGAGTNPRAVPGPALDAVAVAVAVMVGREGPQDVILCETLHRMLTLGLFAQPGLALSSERSLRGALFSIEFKAQNHFSS